MAKIKKELLETFVGNWVIQGKIISAANKHPRTIENWVESNSDMLTTHSVLEAIKEATGLPESEILDYEPQTATA